MYHGCDHTVITEKPDFNTYSGLFLCSNETVLHLLYGSTFFSLPKVATLIAACFCFCTKCRHEARRVEEFFPIDYNRICSPACPQYIRIHLLSVFVHVYLILPPEAQANVTSASLSFTYVYTNT